MKTKFLSLFAVAALVASCSTGKTAETSDSTDAASDAQAVNVVGQWQLEDIVASDSLSVKPSEVESGDPQVIMFTDSTYHVQTNCNIVQGEYTQTGDSIKFGLGLSTKMACPDTRVEDILVQVLPQIATVSAENDSVVKLSSDNSSAYILLKKYVETEGTEAE